MHRSETSLLVGLASVVILLGATTACGNLTAGGIGEATVSMSGDAPEATPAPPSTDTPQPTVVSPPTAGPGPLASAGAEPPPNPSDDDDNDPEGQFEADLTVFLIALDGAMVPITEGEIEVRLDLEGMEEPEIGYSRVTATTYDALRLVFTDVEIEVDRGLVIDGEPVSGAVDIEFDDLTLTVDKPLTLEIGDGERVELLVDLNADSWLLSVDPTTLTVDARTFADLVAVRLR